MVRRPILIAVTALLLIGLVSGTALAASPHFLSASTSGPNAQGVLTVSFKIAGLGDTVTTTVTATAAATAVYACQNNGGNFPTDPKKTQVSGPVSNTGTFTSGKNGQVTGSLTLSPPATTLACTNGQHRVLVSVSYSNVALSSPDAGTVSISGTFSHTFYNI